MAKSLLNATEQIAANSITRALINVATAGSALITKLIAGQNVVISNSGVDAGTGDVTVNSALSFRNRLINGGMDIDQRNSGAAQTITAAAALAYTVDRWYAYCTGANVTGQQVAGTSPLRYAYQFTGAAGVTAIQFGQRIESANSYDLAGSTATLSAYISNSLLTTVTWTAYYATTADTFGTIAAPTRTQIATGSFTVSSTMARYSVNIAVPAAATTGIEVVFSVAAQVSGTWKVQGVQLEPALNTTSATPTAFERRLIQDEQFLCRRYARPLPSMAMGQVYSATAAYVVVPLGSVMRATPALNVVTGFNLATSTGGNAVITALTIGGNSRDDNVELMATTSVTMTAGFATALISPVGAMLVAEL